MSMYEVKDHPVFEQVIRRLEKGDYTISYSTEWFFATVTIRFKNGFCKGIKFDLDYTRFEDEEETCRSIKTYVRPGFFSTSQYIETTQLPEELKYRLIAIADKLVADKKKAVAIAHENSIVTTLDKAFE